MKGVSVKADETFFVRVFFSPKLNPLLSLFPVV
jgi:hypothetical protein